MRYLEYNRETNAAKIGLISWVGKMPRKIVRKQFVAGS
jgi:hypothetical protein